jgi:hypothetical protein
MHVGSGFHCPDSDPLLPFPSIQDPPLVRGWHDGKVDVCKRDAERSGLLKANGKERKNAT